MFQTKSSLTALTAGTGTRRSGLSVPLSTTATASLSAPLAGSPYIIMSLDNDHWFHYNQGSLGGVEFTSLLLITDYYHNQCSLGGVAFTSLWVLIFSADYHPLPGSLLYSLSSEWVVTFNQHHYHHSDGVVQNSSSSSSPIIFIIFALQNKPIFHW